MRPRLIVAAGICAGLGSVPAPAGAACLLCSCSVSAASVVFGTYDPNSASPRDANAVITVNCTSLVSVLGSGDVAISAGTSGTYAARQMASGPNRLQYNLYMDASRTLVWGNGTGGSSIVSYPLNGILSFSSSATVYGRIPTGQFVPGGSYADSLTVTVTY